MMLYSSAVRLDPPRAHLTVSGELDIFTTPLVQRDIEAALDGGCVDFTVDVAAVTFVDASGLGSFVHLHNTAKTSGGSLKFVAASSAFLWVSSVAGLLSAFDLDQPLAERLLA
ncbi:MULTISPECIES: STAS domain-containing protein [unclassified Nocardioides]|uniref:STAS domain-containing protein n=1 Tax=unclassified Nocardioides TaxID=2615069 RepID=UPI00362298D7